MSKIIAALSAAIAPVFVAAALIFHFNYTAEQTTVIITGATALVTAVGTIIAVVLHLGDAKVAAAAHISDAMIGQVELVRLQQPVPERAETTAARPARAK